MLFPLNGKGLKIISHNGCTCTTSSVSFLLVDTSDGDLLTQSTFLIAPLNLTTEAREKLPNASREKLYVCYRMHGVQGRTFSLLSHTWISINVQYYISVTVGMTHISAVGITLFDNGTAQCIKVVITAQQCSATINGKTASAGSLVIGQYQFEFTSTDKSMLIARQRRTNEFFPVVRVSCVPSRASVNQNNLYLYVSDTLPQSHGILGKYIHCSDVHTMCIICMQNIVRVHVSVHEGRFMYICI